MKHKKRQNRCIICCIHVFLFIGFFYTSVYAKVLSVPEVIQEQDQWCWAGVSKAVLDYYGSFVHQCEIAEYTRMHATWYDFGPVNCCADATAGCNYWNYNYGRDGSIQDILQNWGVDNYGSYGALEQSVAVQEITGNRPFIIRWEWVGGGGHFVVGHGLDNGILHYMDPWFGEGLKSADYEWVVAGSQHTWADTNVLTTSPRYPKATLRNPAPGSVLTGSNVLFQWDSVDANEYFLCVGTTLGDNDLFNSSAGTSTSISVTRLPADGSQLYVTLWTRFGEQFEDNDYNSYTYTAYQAPCTYSVSPSSGSFTSRGGTETISVNASSSNCSWTTSENLSWVNLSPTNGTGSRNVTVSVTANAGSARSGSVTIAGKTYTISQDKTPEQTAVILSSTSTNHIITSGSDEKVYGTSANNQITLEIGSRAELINFPGQNNIQIQSSSDLFTVSRSGTVVTFQGSDGTMLKIPATINIQTISFNGEESRVLQIHNNQVMLDDQVINQDMNLIH